MATDDAITSPAHYRHGTIEPLAVIRDWAVPFTIGCVLKYAARYQHSGHALDDLRKMRRYVELEIEYLESLTVEAAVPASASNPSEDAPPRGAWVL